MRNLKLFLAIAAILFCGSTIASASPMLDTWVFTVDNYFLIGGYGTPSLQSWSAAGNLDTQSNLLAYYDDSDDATAAMAALAADGISGLTITANVDGNGLGDIGLTVTGDPTATTTGGTAALSGAGVHTVSLWLHYDMCDPKTDTDCNQFNFVGTGNSNDLAPTWQYQASDYTSIMFAGWPDGTDQPLSGLNGQDTAVYGSGIPSIDYCCDPMLGIAQTKALSTAGSAHYWFSTRWMPPAGYAGPSSPAIVDGPPEGTFYMTQQHVDPNTGDPNSEGTLFYYVPEPGTWLLIPTGLALVYLGQKRRSAR